MESNSSSRRTFIKTAAAASAAATVVGLSPASAKGANDRINFAVIGTGGMGTGHLQGLVDMASEENINIAAVCDVYKRRLNRSVKICSDKGIKTEPFMDYRKVLDRKDIDAVLIATPDHWHSTISIDAMAAGKNVYCEKPMTLTIEQAIQVRDAVKRYNKVFQVGPQATSEDSHWKAQEIIKAGKLGKVTWAMASYNRNIRGCGFNNWFRIDETAGPDKTGEDYVDWDMWLGWKLGLAPRIPWNPEHFFRFRKYFQYNGGVATDLLYHAMAPLLLSIAGDNGEYPKRVNANGGLYIEKNDGRDIPDVFMMAADFPSEFTINLVSVLTNDTSIPKQIFGKYGTYTFGDKATTMAGNGDFVEEFRANNNGYDQVTIHTEKRRDMKGAFIDAIRLGTKVNCNVDLGCATMVAIKMAVESYRQGKTLYWDAQNEKVVTT